MRQQPIRGSKGHTIAWTDKNGRPQVTGRWGEQVAAKMRKIAEAGGTNIRWKRSGGEWQTHVPTTTTKRR